jgi:pimeloyl-ACP methyl ester carboxylesterase
VARQRMSPRPVLPWPAFTAVPALATGRTHRTPRARALRSILAALSCLTVAAAGFACSVDDANDANNAGSPERSATTTESPPATFRPDECPMAIPTSVTIEVDCGRLRVPENRDEPDSRTIELAVARLHSRAADPRPDPVVELSGGPGFPSLSRLERWATSPLLDRRDVILFDQRGLGFSDPNLDCIETNEAIWRSFTTTDPGDVEGQRILDSLASCRQRLVADGVDLDGYDTIQSAADVADLRRALGIDQWNLRGVSYGSALAMEVMRRHPEGLRSVLLDSVVPPDTPAGGVQRGKSALRAFEQLYDACAADNACTAKYGDLKALVAQAVTSLDTDPYRLTVTDPATGRAWDVAITGRDLYAGFFRAMYDPTLIPALPSATQAIANGDRSIIDLLAPGGIEFAASAAEGMTYSVSCADRQRLLDPDAVAPLDAEHPELASVIHPLLPELACQGWGVDASPQSFNALLTGADNDVPVLVMAGAFDPVTPPRGTRRVADALGKELLLFPDAGHGAIATDCGRNIWLTFMDHPTAPPDTSCMDNLATPTFP